MAEDKNHFLERAEHISFYTFGWINKYGSQVHNETLNKSMILILALVLVKVENRCGDILLFLLTER